MRLRRLATNKAYVGEGQQSEMSANTIALFSDK